MADGAKGSGSGTGTDRALSTMVSYVITLGIVALLGAGLFAATHDLVGDQRERAIRAEFDVTGQRLAAGVATVDRLTVTPDGTGTEAVRLRLDLPEGVAGSSYSIRVGNRTADGRHPITLTSTDPAVSRTVRVRTATPVEPTTVDGGPVAVVYDPGSGTLEVTDA